ncbi:MAG TPA: HDIG domain-containing protein [Phycisphaerae bacterium]|nr:HDIG domain-containing protein [Phycisphaerae bacterium]
MWFRKASPRRQAIREDVAEAENIGKQRGARPPVQTTPLVLIGAVFFLVAALLQFWPGELVAYQVGERPGVDVVAPVRFTVESDVQLEEARKSAREYSPPVITAQQSAFDHLHNQLFSLKQDVQGAATVKDLPDDVRARFPGLNEATLRQLQGMDQTSYASMIRSLVYTGMTYWPIVTPADYDRMRKQRSTQVALAGVNGQLTDKEGRLSLVEYRNVLVAGNITSEQRRALMETVEGELPHVVAELVTSYLVSQDQPTFQFDPALTAQLGEQEATLRVPGSRTYEPQQILAPRGKPLTAEELYLIGRAQAEVRRIEEQEHPLLFWLGRLGLLATVGILTAAGMLYVSRMNAAVRSVGRGWAVCALLLAMLIVSRAAVGYFPQSLYLSGIAPTLLTAIILVIAYNQRFALGMAAIQGLLVTLTLRQGFDFYLSLLTGVAVLSFGLNEIRTRGKLIEMGAFAAAAMFLAVLALGLSRVLWSTGPGWSVTPDMTIVLRNSLWATAGGMGVAMVALAALPSIERIFRITTAMTLLELCDANKPLLRRLSQEAPGTFNHSLTVGIMAEAAGNAIGANGLLCRVGAYYHDVGKLSKPLYFIENQRSGGPNRHDKLSPAMSLLIIVGHVKDGVELAREYALPWIVHQFIEQHHGTTLVEYFFHAARKKAEEGDGGVVVSDTEFRYPGPKPQTREAAIVMICDGCESAVRAIDEPTAGRIESAVHGIIMKRLMDGQFNECDLTLRDLSRIEETLTRALAAVHHGRVAYPTAVESPALGAARPA